MKKAAPENKPPVCLAIGGLDPSGGAGLIADVTTFVAFGCFATAAITSITFQNSKGVSGAVHQTADSVRRQIEAVLSEHDVRAVKTGMLPTREIVETLAGIIKERGIENVVVDPVISSTSGFRLINDEALAALIEDLFPLATLLTPNRPEAALIAKLPIRSIADIEKAASLMQSMGAKNVLIKGGHLAELKIETTGAKQRATDLLFTGGKLSAFDDDLIEGAANRGTGCILASAIAANLSLRKPLDRSIRSAKDHVTEIIRRASDHNNIQKIHSVA